MSGRGMKRTDQTWQVERIRAGKRFDAPETRDERRWRRARLRIPRLNVRSQRRTTLDQSLSDLTLYLWPEREFAVVEERLEGLDALGRVVEAIRTEEP